MKHLALNRSRLKIGIYWVLFLALLNTKAYSQTNGQLDSAFGMNGVVTSLITSNARISSPCYTLQADGKILSATALAGATAMPLIKVIRYMPNGDIDNSWGQYGIATVPVPGTLNNMILDTKVQADGKVIVAGLRDTLINGQPLLSGHTIRLLPNGALDVGFGDNGRIMHFEENKHFTHSHLMILGSRILVFGNENPGNILTIEAFNMADGTIDSTWGNNGILKYDFGDINTIANLVQSAAVQTDGKIVFTFKELIFRILPSGHLDTDFADNGHLTPQYARTRGVFDIQNTKDLLTIAIQADGKILVAGKVSYSQYQDLGVVERYFPDGALDTTFGNQGIALVDFRLGKIDKNVIRSINIHDKGFIVAGTAIDSAAQKYIFAMVRFSDLGKIDTSFGNNGIVRAAPFYANENMDILSNAIVQPDDKILLTGYTRLDSGIVSGLPLNSFSLSRYNFTELSTNVPLALEQSKIQVAPNPITDYVYVSSEYSAIRKVLVYNLQGQIQNTQSYSDILKATQIDMSNYSSGIYFMHITLLNGEHHIQKVMKTRCCI